MTQEYKDLLLKDLCARLPYNTEIQVNDWAILTTTLKVGHISRLLNEDLEIKPYLFPLSSMTNELWDKEFRGWGITEFTRDSFKYGCETLEFYDGNPVLSDVSGFINSLIKNHFDIYGLIPMGLALDATGLNIY